LTDAHAARAAADAEAFVASRASRTRADGQRELEEARSLPPDELLRLWRTNRQHLLDSLRTLDPRARVPWFGPPMSAMSHASARLMETWAHGQDIAEALGITRRPTARLRHVAWLGYRTLPNGFAARGRAVPDEPVRVELAAPDGTQWTFGPAGATNRLAGPAVDFCLLVTQRRHRADLALQATGPVAQEWLDVAQAFAGPPGAGREPAGAGALP
jgi:uncharacterized protein (TIGR03084 family)